MHASPLPRRLKIENVEAYRGPSKPALGDFCRERLLPFISSLKDADKAAIASEAGKAIQLDGEMERLGLDRKGGIGFAESMVRIATEPVPENNDADGILDYIRKTSGMRASMSGFARRMVEEGGLYFDYSICGVSKVGVPVAIADVSHVVFRNRVYVVDCEEHGKSVAGSSYGVIAFFRGASPDFLSSGIVDECETMENGVRKYAAELARIGKDDGYFLGSERELEALRTFGVEPHLFANMAIHEIRHTFEKGLTGERFTLENGEEVQGLSECKMKTASLEGGVHEATAYLSMLIDGPDIPYVLGRLFTLITDRPDCYPHRIGAQIALFFTAMQIHGADKDFFKPEALLEKMRQLAAVDHGAIRKAAHAAMLDVYTQVFGIVDSNTF